MSCGGGQTFRIDPTSTEIKVNSDNANVCQATVILDRLHKEFTEQYTESTDALKNHPTFHLRKQPALGGFNNEGAGTIVDRFYKIFTTIGDTDPSYRGAVNAIMKGEYDISVDNEGRYKQYPQKIAELKDFTAGSDFKGIYGLHKVTELLDAGIRAKIAEKHMPTADVNFNDNIFSKYQKRQGVKDTIEEIARRENQLYREKFLNIILILVGLFIVSTQLVNKYFSFGGGGGGGGGFGFGGVGGWLSTRFGSGGSGLFSRFGGIGLGSSGRSRVGNLFTRSPYASSPR